MIKEGIITHLFALSAFVQPLLSLSSWNHLITLVTQEGTTKQERIPRSWEPPTTLRWSDTGYFLCLGAFQQTGAEVSCLGQGQDSCGWERATGDRFCLLLPTCNLFIASLQDLNWAARKSREKSFHLCCQYCCLYYFPCFSSRVNIKLLQAWAGLCQGLCFKQTNWNGIWASTKRDWALLFLAPVL